jgi:hypothetical protein
MTNSNPLRTIAWNIAGLFTGIVVALVLLIAVEAFSAVVHPLPPDFAGTEEEMCAHVARYPQWVLAVVVPAWAFTAWAATWSAKRIGSLAYASPLGRGRELSSGRGKFAPLAIALLLAAAVVCNVSMLPYPLWFKIVMPLAVIAAALAALRPRRRRVAAGGGISDVDSQSR